MSRVSDDLRFAAREGRIFDHALDHLNDTMGVKRGLLLSAAEEIELYEAHVRDLDADSDQLHAKLDRLQTMGVWLKRASYVIGGLMLFLLLLAGMAWSGGAVYRVNGPSGLQTVRIW